jgi:hypothetical protein
MPALDPRTTHTTSTCAGTHAQARAHRHTCMPHWGEPHLRTSSARFDAAARSVACVSCIACALCSSALTAAASSRRSSSATAAIAAPTATLIPPLGAPRVADGLRMAAPCGSASSASPTAATDRCADRISTRARRPSTAALRECCHSAHAGYRLRTAPTTLCGAGSGAPVAVWLGAMQRAGAAALSAQQSAGTVSRSALSADKHFRGPTGGQLSRPVHTGR